MGTLLLLITLGVITYYITQPYFTKRKLSLGSVNGDKSDDLYTQYTNLLSTIKELEFDHRIGNLSSEDFNEMNARYRNDAISVLKQLEKPHKGTSPKRTGSKNAFCPACGTPVGKKDRYCSSCGEQIQKS